MLILGIDPSINNVGVAILDTETEVLFTDCFHPVRDKNTSMSVVSVRIARHIHTILQGKKVDMMVLEFPQWEDSERGWVAMKQGHILNLAFIVGYLAASFGLPASKVFTPTVQEWKGSMPKKAIEDRFKESFPDMKIPSDHEFEAAMLIRYIQTLHHSV